MANGKQVDFANKALQRPAIALYSYHHARLASYPSGGVSGVEMDSFLGALDVTLRTRRGRFGLRSA
jgi:hypothetical protein